jgi:purine-cytosine permease-like protein
VESRVPNNLKPPALVVLSIIGSTLSAVAGIGAYAALNPRTRDHLGAAIVTWTLLAAIPYFLVLRGQYRGRDWARLLWLVLIAFTVILMPGQLALFHEPWKGPLYIAQTVVDVLAVGALFLPQSNAWFSARRTAAAPKT